MRPNVAVHRAALTASESRRFAGTEEQRLRAALKTLGVTDEDDIDRLALGIRPGTVGWMRSKHGWDRE